jgi:hypothetical protein
MQKLILFSSSLQSAARWLASRLAISSVGCWVMQPDSKEQPIKKSVVVIFIMVFSLLGRVD